MEGYGSQGSAAIDGINDVSEFFEDSLIPGQKGAGRFHVRNSGNKTARFAPGAAVF
jgi:hypothetical protein